MYIYIYIYISFFLSRQTPARPSAPNRGAVAVFFFLVTLNSVDFTDLNLTHSVSVCTPVALPLAGEKEKTSLNNGLLGLVTAFDLLHRQALYINH